MLRQLSVCLLVFTIIFGIQVLAHTHIISAMLKRHSEGKLGGSIVENIKILFIILFLIVSAHSFNISVWAGFYLLTGSLRDYETAFYFSMTSYSTLGYGDIVLPREWNLLGPFEALCGSMMFAWSISFFYSINTLLVKKRLEKDIRVSINID